MLHRAATDLRNMKGEESVMEPCLWTFRDENGVIHALCLVYVDDFTLARSDPPFGKHVFESINNLYGWREWESRVFKQCGAQLTQVYNKHTGTWRGFEISFKEYVKEISIITLPSHRRRNKKFKITPLELAQLRALYGKLLWLGVQCLPQLLAPLSLLMGQTPQAVQEPLFGVNFSGVLVCSFTGHIDVFRGTASDTSVSHSEAEKCRSLVGPVVRSLVALSFCVRPARQATRQHDKALREPWNSRYLCACIFLASVSIALWALSTVCSPAAIGEVRVHDEVQ